MAFSIDPASWTQLNRLLDEALDLPLARRSAWLDTLDAAHSALKPQLCQLLERAASIETGEFLGTLPRVDIADDSSPTQKQACSGEVVGPYRLLRELGSGGMGEVWLAERTDGMLNRPVALKLPHLARKNAGLAERMAREREILATLSHPNIARLYDAGLANDGQPYLAIEYVEGKNLNAYCRDRSLGLKARLKLFAQVGNAVAYAHAKLIVHRDLKPANILVTAMDGENGGNARAIPSQTTDGQVRLLDFGIAKLLEDGETKKTRLTEISGRALSLEYASPEQIQGEPLSIASDIYSLGVVLYELLAGERPYKLKRDSRGALEDAIVQLDPKPPSDVAPTAYRKALRGDLDTIVLKALRKQPEDRYATVNALVDDLFRYLDNKPVFAQPASRWYVLGKFVKRNRLIVSAVTAAFLAVVGGAAAATWQTRVARAEQRHAQETTKFLTDMFQDADPYGRLGKSLTAAELLQGASRGLGERFQERPQARVELLGILGSSLKSLGEYGPATTTLKRAIAANTELYGATDTRTLRMRLYLADVYGARQDTDALRELVQQLMPLVEPRTGEHPELWQAILGLQTELAYEDGRFDDEKTFGRQAFVLARQVYGDRDTRTVTASTVLAESYLRGGVSNEVMLKEVERGLQFALAAYSENTSHPHVLRARQLRSRAFGVAGNFHESIKESMQALEASQQVLGSANLLTAEAMINLSGMQRRVGNVSAAVSLNNQVIDILIEQMKIEPHSADHAFALMTRGVTLLAARQPTAALQDLDAAAADYLKLSGAKHWDTITARLNRATALAYLGKAQEARSEFDSALVPEAKITLPHWVAYVDGILRRLAGDYPAALAAQRRSLALTPAGPRAEWDRGRVLAELGAAQFESNDLDAAQITLTQVADLHERLGIQMNPSYAEVSVQLAKINIKRGKPREALPLVISADDYWRGFDPDSRSAGEAALWLARCYLAQNRRAEASEPLQRAERLLGRSQLPSHLEPTKLARHP